MDLRTRLSRAKSSCKVTLTSRRSDERPSQRRGRPRLGRQQRQSMARSRGRKELHGEKKNTDAKFKDEITTKLKHTGAGIISMENAGPNTNGSQFFITLAPTPSLHGKHTIFGRVCRGMEIIKRLGSVQTDNNDRNKVQELHKPSTEEGPASIKDVAIVHVFGLERRGGVRGLGFGAFPSKVDAQAYQNQNMKKLNQKLLLLEQELYG
ncbi:unnamed protein product [Camellia sinensis]